MYIGNKSIYHINRNKTTKSMHLRWVYKWNVL